MTTISHNVRQGALHIGLVLCASTLLVQEQTWFVESLFALSKLLHMRNQLSNIHFLAIVIHESMIKMCLGILRRLWTLALLQSFLAMDRAKGIEEGHPMLATSLTRRVLSTSSRWSSILPWACVKSLINFCHCLGRSLLRSP
jgi:hypothetical protein